MAAKKVVQKKTAQKKIKAVGTRAEVMHGTAKHTSGGLKKSDLMYNKWGAIVSKKKHELGMKRWKLVKDVFMANKAPAFKKGHK